MTTVHLPRDESNTHDELELVIDAARSAIDQEFRIAERLDAKARNQITVAGAWYAVVAGVAGVAIGRALDANVDSWVTGAIIVLTGTAGVALTGSLLFSYAVWRLRAEEDLAPAGIREMKQGALDPQVNLRPLVVDHLEYVLKTRRASNEQRVQSFRRSVDFWVLALVLTTADLVWSMIALALAQQ